MFPPIQRAACGRPLPPVAGGPVLPSPGRQDRPGKGGQLHLRWASAASQESSPTPALPTTPPKRGIRHITELRSRQFHYRALLGAQYGLRPCQYPSGASTITERSCPYALWAWKNFNTCQLRLLRARSLSRLGLLSRLASRSELLRSPSRRKATIRFEADFPLLWTVTELRSVHSMGFAHASTLRVPVRSQNDRASTSRNGTWKTLENTTVPPVAGIFNQRLKQTSFTTTILYNPQPIHINRTNKPLCY